MVVKKIGLSVTGLLLVVTLFWFGAIPVLVHMSNGMLVIGDTQTHAISSSAASKFDAAGLEIESVVVVQSPICFGEAVGRFLDWWGTDLILLCNSNEDTLTHELAHNWVYDNTSNMLRARFLKRFNFPTWENYNTMWGMRGTEAAAEVIVWGVDADEPIVFHAASMKSVFEYSEAWLLLTSESTGMWTLEDRLKIERFEHITIIVAPQNEENSMSNKEINNEPTWAGGRKQGNGDALKNKNEPDNNIPLHTQAAGKDFKNRGNSFKTDSDMAQF